MIREKFPEKRFPNFSLQEISAELYQRLAPLVPEFLQVSIQILIIIKNKVYWYRQDYALQMFKNVLTYVKNCLQ